MPRATDELLELLSRHHGIDTPAVAGPPAAARFDLSRADRLIGLDDDDVAARLEARVAGDPEDPLPALRAELRAFADSDHRCAPTTDLGAARAAAIDAARAATGRTVVVAAAGCRSDGLGDVDAPQFGDFDDTARSIDRAGTDLACLLLEPRADAGTLRDLVGRARASGALVVLDESRTAARLAPTTVTAALGLDADAVLLGPSLAAGMPFAALLTAADAPPLPPPDPATAEVALAVCARLRAAPVADALAARGAALATRFAARCRQDDVHAELAGPPALPHLRFAGQENAEAPLIAHHFQLELAALGVHAAADVAVPVGLSDSDVTAIGDALEAAVARIRTLLIEHNSYLSGGVPFVFEGNDDRLRDRGIARYRHPKLAAVDIEPVEGRPAMRIAFAAGPLGPITSSGFYLPTRLRGDFDIRVHYQVVSWEPGPDSACLGLFVQNEPSTARYYAQIMSTSDRPDEISAAAGLTGELVGRRTIEGRSGELRLVRSGDLLTASHRGAGDPGFTVLGSQQPCCRDDVITGAKIWSKVHCGGLVVDLSAMTVEAGIPDDQIPRLEARPDPRQA